MYRSARACARLRINFLSCVYSVFSVGKTPQYYACSHLGKSALAQSSRNRHIFTCVCQVSYNICIYIHIYTYHQCLYIYIYIYIHTYIQSAHFCPWRFKHDACQERDICICMYVCVCVCTTNVPYIHTQSHTHTYIHMRIHIYIQSARFFERDARIMIVKSGTWLVSNKEYGHLYAKSRGTSQVHILPSTMRLCLLILKIQYVTAVWRKRLLISVCYVCINEQKKVAGIQSLIHICRFVCKA